LLENRHAKQPDPVGANHGKTVKKSPGGKPLMTNMPFAGAFEALADCLMMRLYGC